MEALIEAIRHGNYERTKRLIDEGADVNSNSVS